MPMKVATKLILISSLMVMLTSAYSVVDPDPTVDCTLDSDCAENDHNTECCSGTC